MSHLISFLYCFSIFTCLITGMFLLFSHTTSGLRYALYRKTRIFIAVATLLVGVGKTITLFRDTYVLLDIFPFTPFIIASLQACLLLFSVLAIFNSEYVTLKNIMRWLSPLFIFIFLYVIALLFSPDLKIYSWREYFRNIGHPVLMVRTAFVLTYIVQLVLYIRLFNREWKIYNKRINDYFSDTDTIRVTWGARLFYEALGIGVTFLLVCSYPSVWTDGIFTVIIAIFYFSFAVRCINYEYKLLILQSAVHDDTSAYFSTSTQLSTLDSLDERLQRFIAQEQPFLKQGIVIADIATQLNVPSRELSFFINNTYGRNFNSWINWLRVEHAKMLMAQSPSLSFVEIAELSGFPDKSKFSRVFKETTGCLYKDYIKHH